MSDSVRVSVRIIRSQRNALQGIADSQDLKFSDLVRYSIHYYIMNFKSWKTIFDSIRAHSSNSNGSQILKSQIDIPNSTAELN